ncbi:MAG: hypothetical protein ABFS17_00205 [Chloroflexota bacterium]
MRDLREYARKTNLRLAVGFFLVLLIIGDGLIYWLYGPSAAVSGLICIFAGMVPLIFIALVMLLLDVIVKKANDE